MSKKMLNSDTMSIKKTYAVFGLGRYGVAVARELVLSGAEVIAVDSDIDIVNDPHEWRISNNMPLIDSPETRKKISEAQKGREFTKEHRQKLSEAAQKRHVPCSEAKKKKLSQNYPHKRKVYCEELDKVFDSVQQCSKELNIPATNISKLCKGKGKTLKGYHLRYYNDTINA